MVQKECRKSKSTVEVMKTKDVKDEILRKTDEGRLVFEHYSGCKKPHKNFLNPEYHDTKPSCSYFYSAEKHIYLYKDQGGDLQGDCFRFAAGCLGLDCQRQFREVLQRIIQDMSLCIDMENRNLPFVPKNKLPVAQQSTAPSSHVPIVEKEEAPKRYKFVEKHFSLTELDYWKRYGITPDILMKYDVVSLDSYESVGEKGPYCYTSTSQSPIFGYKGDAFIKIYRPKEKLRFQFGGKKPRPYCFGLNQLPFRGDMVFITGGEKDVLTLVSHGFSAVCFNSETAEISTDILDMLAMRFKHIFILYDMDDTGRKVMDKAEQELVKYDVRQIHLPLEGTKQSKDVSDYFAAGNKASQLHEIVCKQLEVIYAQSMMLINTCLMDFENPPEPSPVIIQCGEVPIGISDNIMCVTGGEGTGKSNLLSTFIAGALLTTDDHEELDMLGFTIAPNKERKALLHFDTEQSGPHLYKNTETAKRRAKLEKYPPFYYALNMVAQTRQQRMKTIRDMMDLSHHKHGGIHLVIIDGAADLVSSANNEAECTILIEELYRLAGMYHTCIVFALHHIPNGLKIRGHIGSETHRKAAGILSVEKDENPTFSVIKAVKVRDGSALDMPMTLITWSKEDRMFVSAGHKSTEYVKNEKIDKLRKAAMAIFKNQDAYTFGVLANMIAKEVSCEDKTAKSYINFMVKEGILEKTKYNNYKLKNKDD